MNRFAANVARLLIVALCVIATGATPHAQDAADLQALKKEIEALRQRQEALEKEVDALKTAQARPVPAAAAVRKLENLTLRLDRAPMKGQSAAKVVLVEVSDFECPFCARHTRQTAPLIEKEYVQTGRIRSAFVHFPIASHRNAFKAAEAATCAGDQGKFWETHQRFFANQRQLALPTLYAHASALGLNDQQFRTCLDGGKYTALVTNDVTAMRGAGVTATPTFFVGTLDSKTGTFAATERIVGAKPFAVFQQAIDAALARK